MDTLKVTPSAFMPVIGREKQCQSSSMQFINICILSFTVNSEIYV